MKNNLIKFIISDKRLFEILTSFAKNFGYVSRNATCHPQRAHIVFNLTNKSYTTEHYSSKGRLIKKVGNLIDILAENQKTINKKVNINKDGSVEIKTPTIISKKDFEILVEKRNDVLNIKKQYPIVEFIYQNKNEKRLRQVAVVKTDACEDIHWFDDMSWLEGFDLDDGNNYKRFLLNKIPKREISFLGFMEK